MNESKVSSNVLLGLVIFVVVALAGGFFLASGSDDTYVALSTPATEQAEASDTLTASQETTDAETIEVAASGSNGIMDYSPEALAASDAENNLLFFHAAWCTVCNSVERNIEAGSIPDGLSIFKVDYDSDIGQDLASQYNIPIQYSMVQVDASGEEITQWVNNFGDGIDDINNNLL